MIKMIRVAVVILAIFGMVLNISGVSFAQDDDGGGGGGGDVGDVGDAGDAGDVVDTGDAEDSVGASDAGDIDDKRSDTTDYKEEAAVETQYEETAVSVPVTISSTTNVTHQYGSSGYVYDRSRSAIVDAAVAGAVVGVAAGSAASIRDKGSAVVEKTTKRPVMIKKRPPAETAPQILQTTQASQTAQAKNKEDKK